MSAHDPVPLRIGGTEVPVVTTNTVVVGTGSAGYCAAARLVQFGQPDIVMVTDKIHAGTSRNAGSDKQTYYKLTLSGPDGDSVREMAQTLFNGGAMDGDNALAEAALSARAFLHLVDAGVPFPQNRYGEFVGYKTDHDPRQRATSVGPYTSRTMVEKLEQRVLANGTRVFDECRVVDLITVPEAGGGRRVAGLLVLRTDVPAGGGESPWLLFRCANIVYATGGPAGMYATRVFPNGQWGASGAAYRAGVHGKNLTEWQFGLASLHPRWNVSGTYMQAIPRFVSTDADGGDEREFLTEAIGDYGRLVSLTFLKGYQWPFDIRKAREGSSLVDLLVYRETVLRGRRVFLDFRRNPVREDFDADALSEEAHAYLERAGALTGTPIQRLRHMNEPSYQFYLHKNPYVDLETEPLEVDVCAQHNNGGLVVDSWWQSNLAGFFPVGEAGGAHGVYRPGGAALNSGQVGATRAAQFIAARGTAGAPDEAGFVTAAAPVLAEALDLAGRATGRAASGLPDVKGDDPPRTPRGPAHSPSPRRGSNPPSADNTGELLRDIQQLMSAKAGPVRSAESIRQALAQVEQWLASYPDSVVADGGSRRSVNRIFLVRDILTTAYVYLSAMADFVAHGGRSRGSVLYTDTDGSLPRVGHGPDPEAELDLPEVFRFQLDGGALDDEIQEASYAPGTGAGTVGFRWRPRRPIPAGDDFFENVWREFREHGAVIPD